MNRRSLLVALLLLLAGAGRIHLQTIEPVATRSLELLPFALEEWSGVAGPALDPSVAEVLGADDYINRLYRTDAAMAGVFVGYHRSQKHGASIHSPLNCLPGAGWQPIDTERRALRTRGRATQVVVRKGEDRQLVLYWYHTAARVEGNEYWSKFHLVFDAVTAGRNDAALVRIAVPVDARRAEGQSEAARAAYRLAELIEPQVTSILFSDS